MPSLAQDYAGKEVAFSGNVNGAISTGQNSRHYPLRLTQINGQSLTIPVNLRMSIHHNAPFKTNILPGDQISGFGNMELPGKARNPGGFDYQYYLRSEGRYFVIYPQQNELEITDSRLTPHRLGHILAEYLKESYRTNLTAKTYPWVMALSMGDLSYLEAEDQELLNEAGARHLTAVSGLHINLLAFTMLSFLLARGVTKKFAIGLCLLFIWFYASIAGFSPSIMRAAAMLTFFFAGSLLGLRYSPVVGLLASFTIITAFFPYMIFNIGFQLSFAATFFILLIYPVIRSRTWNFFSYFIEPLKIAISAQLGVFPIILYHFGWFSTGSVLLAPLVALVLAPLLIALFILGLLGFLGTFYNALLMPVNVFIEFAVAYLVYIFSLVANISPSIWGHWPFPRLISYYFFAISLFYCLQRPLIFRPIRYIPAIALLSLLVLSLSFFPISPSLLRTYYLDVGQGDAAAVFTPGGNTILVDGGGLPP